MFRTLTPIASAKQRSHASTFGGNPVAIAAALASMDVIEREGMRNASSVGEKLKQRMSTWIQKYPIVGDVRGKGLMLAVEIVKDKQSKAPVSKVRDRIVELAFENGVLLLGAGETSIRLSPPLIITQEQGDYALDVLEKCLGQVG